MAEAQHEGRAGHRLVPTVKKIPELWLGSRVCLTQENQNSGHDEGTPGPPETAGRPRRSPGGDTLSPSPRGAARMGGCVLSHSWLSREDRSLGTLRAATVQGELSPRKALARARAPMALPAEALRAGVQRGGSTGQLRPRQRTWLPGLCTAATPAPGAPERRVSFWGRSTGGRVVPGPHAPISLWAGPGTRGRSRVLVSSGDPSPHSQVRPETSSDVTN